MNLSDPTPVYHSVVVDTHAIFERNRTLWPKESQVKAGDTGGRAGAMGDAKQTILNGLPGEVSGRIPQPSPDIKAIEARLREKGQIK